MASPSHKVKRQADSGVRDALESIHKNQKFKRMMIFGLRSLSDLCVPPAIKYKENSLAVLESGELPILMQTSTNFAGDEEVTALLGKVFFGISEALLDEHQSVAADLEVQGFSASVSGALAAGISDENSLVYYLDTLKNLGSLGIQCDMLPMAATFLTALNPRMKAPIVKRLLEVLEYISGTKRGAEILAEKAGIEKILSSVSKRTDCPAAVGSALTCCKNIAAVGKASSAHLDLVIEVMETNKDKPLIQKAGSAALGAMVSPNDLKNCLSVLKSTSGDTPERASALTTLSSMSYISSCAEQLVEAGGIPLLVEAVAQSGAQLSKGSKDPRTVKGLTGAAKMLASVGQNSNQKDQIAKCGGVKHIVAALNSSLASPAANSACADALRPLMSVEACAKEAVGSKAVQTLIASMAKHSTNPDILRSCMGTLAEIASHESLRADMTRDGCVEAVAKYCGAACVAADMGFQAVCIQLARHLASTADFAKLQAMIDPLSAIISKNAAEVSVAEGGMDILSRLAHIDGAAAKMTSGAAVEAAMSVMLEHTDCNPPIAMSARGVLELLANERDVTRTLNDLETAINGARTQPARALRCLAAVNGLSQVARLKTMFEKKDAAGVIVKGMAKWIQGTKFNDQQRIIKAGCHCIEPLAVHSAMPVESLLMSLCAVIQEPGLKALRERQGDQVDNSLIDLCLVLEHLCATHTISDPSAGGALIDQILHIMRKYSDARRAQVCCIQALRHLAAQNQVIAQKIVESGALRSVLGYMNKVAMYEDVQVAGCSLLLTMAKASDRIVDNLKSGDAVTIVRNATRMHRRSAELNKYAVPLLGYLVPESETEKIIHENMREIDAAILAGDHEKALRCLQQVNGVTLNTEGAKVAARCDFGRTIDAVMLKLAPKLGNKEQALLHAELAVAARNMSGKPVGVANLQKHGGINHLLAMFESLKQANDKEGVKAVLVATQRLLQKDRNQSDVCFKKGFVSKICLFAEANEDDADLLCESAQTMASMKKSKELIQNVDFRRYIANLCAKIGGDGSREKKWPLIQALEALLLVPDDEIIRIVLDNKGLQALYKLMDDFPDDWPMIRKAQRCVDTIAQMQDLRALHKKMPEPAPLERVVKTTKRILRGGKNEPDTAAMSLKNLNRIVMPEDRKMLSEANLLPEIEELMTAHPQHDLLMKACADYLGKLGVDDQLNSLMRKIIEICEAKPANWQKLVTDLNNKLALYLAADLADPAKALALTPQCMDRLADACKATPTNVPMLTSTVAVCRRVARKSKTEPSAPYGIASLQTKMMPCLVELLSKDGMDPTKRPRKLLIDGFHTLADCGRHSTAHKPLLEICDKFKTIAYADELLRHHASDPDVVAAILDFLAAVASQPSGADMLTSQLGTSKGRRVGAPELEDTIMALLKKHRKHPGVAEAAFDLLGNMGAHGKTMSPKLKDPVFVGELREMKDTPQMLVGNINLHKKLIKKEKPEETLVALITAQNDYKLMMADPSVSDADKIEVAAALADFVGACAEEGLMNEVKKAGGIDALVDMFENHPKDLPVMLRVLPALKRCAQADSDSSAKIARTAVKAMAGPCEATISGDFEASQHALALLKTVASEEGNGRVLAQMEGFQGLLADIGNLASEAKGHEAEEMKCLTESIKQMVKDDQPEHLTLQSVHAKWVQKKQEGEKLCLSESSAVLKYWDFVSDYTEEYSKEPHKDLKSGLGLEWTYGCLCYQLLHEMDTNSRPCVEKNNEPAVFLKAMAKQRNDLAGQCAILVANDAVQWPEAVEIWANTPNANAIVGEMLNRGRKIGGVTDAEREALLMPRMQLVERLAVTRTYFNGTECMAALIGLWDDYDANKYSVELLKQVFKSMRQIVNDHWVGIILQNNVPKRLIDVVVDKNARLDLLPDVLFLLAALAVVPEIKTMIGELKGVEGCLDLLVRSLKNPTDTAAVQTNDCLAMGAITLGHGANLQRFVMTKGLELNIQCMDNSLMGQKIEYDVANAASLLMCNTCFKRDEMKELYGKKGACQAVMKSITKYDGSEDVKAFRCLGTMFKAIGNLALYTPNVDIFMAGNIEKVFAHLYEKSERLPDNLMEASLRTLSNLAMENTDTNMMRFGVTLSPILFMLSQGQRTSIAMFTLAFDVLASLCRLPANSKEFLRKDGISTCLKILNSYSDPYLYSNGVHVLGIQTTTPEAVSELIKHGVFDFLSSLLESQVAADDLNGDLCVSGLRCMRRLLKSKQNVLDLIKAGGIEQIRQVMKKPADLPMLHMECHRVLLNCLSMFPPPTPPPPTSPGGKADDGWSGEVPDEGVLSAIESMDRPPGPRSWESCEFDEQMITSFIESLCAVLMREENVKQDRLVRAALGLLAYFACEKIPGTLDAFYKAEISQVLRNVFDWSEAEADVIKTGCYILNNVAYASEPELYVKLRKDREMRKALDVASQKIGGGAKSFCDLTLKLINEKSADPSRFEIHMQWTYPLELTWWDKDKYPMGVQDLPAEYKEELRAGGKWKTIVGEKERELFHWKSSMDLMMMNWRVDAKEGPWQHSIGVSRLCNISKGLASETLRIANEKGSATSKPRDGECLVLRGLPCEEFPNGVELSIVCGSKRSRDKFFDLITEWREAAAFGF